MPLQTRDREADPGICLIPPTLAGDISLVIVFPYKPKYNDPLYQQTLSPAHTPSLPSFPVFPRILWRFTNESNWRFMNTDKFTNHLKTEWSRSVVSDSLWSHGLQPTRLLGPWNFPGKRTGVGCHFLLQGIFSTQGSILGLPHCRQTLYHLSHQGNPGNK